MSRVCLNIAGADHGAARVVGDITQNRHDGFETVVQLLKLFIGHGLKASRAHRHLSVDQVPEAAVEQAVQAGCRSAGLDLLHKFRQVIVIQCRDKSAVILRRISK